jgi:4-hydroxy-3-polyprenylbenzoate decarboxylase
MPIAVALGGDPAYTYSATAPLPDNVDEFLLAGFLRKQRVKLVKCITVELEVPSDADIIIEGYVDPAEELIWEGPFGDHTGFYSLADWFPKFHVTCITHRNNAVYPATIVGVPPMEDTYMAKLTERIFLSPIKLSMIPELQDLNLPLEGVAHNIAIVKIEKTYPGQAQKVAHALWGAGQMMFNKFLIVVDGNVDIHNPLALVKHVSQNFNPLHDTLFSRGPLDILDHASEKPSVGGKLLIDATNKLDEELFAEKHSESIDSSRLSETLGVGIKGVVDYNSGLIANGVSVLIVSVDKTLNITVKNVIQKLVGAIESMLPKMILVVDKEMRLSGIDLVCWFASGNIDPSRDCYFLDKGGKQLPCLVLDGTSKSFPIDNFVRDWPNIVTSDKQTIQMVDSKWNDLGIKDLILSPSLRFQSFNQGSGAIVKNL